MPLSNERTRYMEKLNTITVEVAYAKADKQALIQLTVPLGTTVQQAIDMSKIVEQFPEINWDVNKIGIFSKPCKFDTVLREKDRVEIYRPLIADPKEVRKRRAKKAPDE